MKDRAAARGRDRPDEAFGVVEDLQAGLVGACAAWRPPCLRHARRPSGSRRSSRSAAGRRRTDRRAQRHGARRGSSLRSAGDRDRDRRWPARWPSRCVRRSCASASSATPTSSKIAWPRARRISNAARTVWQPSSTRCPTWSSSSIDEGRYVEILTSREDLLYRAAGDEGPALSRHPAAADRRCASPARAADARDAPVRRSNTR